MVIRYFCTKRLPVHIPYIKAFINAAILFKNIKLLHFRLSITVHSRYNVFYGSARTFYEKDVINVWRLHVIPSAGTSNCGPYMSRYVISTDVITRVDIHTLVHTSISTHQWRTQRGDTGDISPSTRHNFSIDVML